MHSSTCQALQYKKIFFIHPHAREHADHVAGFCENALDSPTVT